MTRLSNPTNQSARTWSSTRPIRFAALALGGVGFFAVLGWSGVTAFQRPVETVPLAVVESSRTDRPQLGQRPAPVFSIDVPTTSYEEVGATQRTQQHTEVTPRPQPQARVQHTTPQPTSVATGVKFCRLGKVIIVNGKPWTGKVFDHRPIRPVKTRTMKTTAYSPDEKSCGKWADGITASGKSVWMNGGRLVAADRKIPYGTILTIPGYNYGKPVQVWDRGGAIKGNRLDLLYPTHEIALQWGVQDLPVVFWEFVKTD